MSRHTRYSVSSTGTMPTRSMSIQEQEIQYLREQQRVSAQNERPRRHGGDWEHRGEGQRLGPEGTRDIHHQSRVLPRSNRRSVTIDSDIVFVSEPSYSTISSPPPVHIPPPRRSQSFKHGRQHGEHDESKPLPSPPQPRGPHDSSSPLDPNLQPPYWMESIGHAIWTLGITVGHLIGTAATSILIFILGLIHCIMTGVLLVIGTVFDGLTTILRILFNIFTCHFQSGEWGWEWTHLTRAWQWGRKSQWVWETVGRVNTETEERDEKVAKRLSLHEARKEEYKREQEAKAQMQATGLVIPANKRHGVAALYGGRSMAFDLEKGFGSGPQPGPSSRPPYY